jgi:hypothetical protein
MNGAVLDLSILDDIDLHKIIREDIQKNRIEYEFPDGFNTLDLFEECRALTMLDDIEAMFNVFFLLLSGKPVIIYMKNYGSSRTEICRFRVVDRHRNLREIATVDKYPCLILWLTEFLGGTILERITKASKRCAAPSGTGTKGRQEETEDAGVGAETSGEIVRKHFGSELLFTLYEFGHEMHYEPDCWEKVFEFAKYSKVRNIFTQLARAQAKAAQGG